MPFQSVLKRACARCTPSALEPGTAPHLAMVGKKCSLRASKKGQERPPWDVEGGRGLSPSPSVQLSPSTEETETGCPGRGRVQGDDPDCCAGVGGGYRAMGTHQPGTPQPGWSVASSLGRAQSPLLAATLDQAPGADWEALPPWQLAPPGLGAGRAGEGGTWQWGAGTKVPGVGAAEFQVLGGIQGSCFARCKKQQ